VHTHSQYKKEKIPGKLDELIVEDGWICSKFQHNSHPCTLLNLAIQIRTHSIESKSQCSELTTLKKNSIVENGDHSFINHHATRCECYIMPSSKGKVVEQTSL
jgi:hypothetical protein